MSELGLGTGHRGHRAQRKRRSGCVPVIVAFLLIAAIGVFAYVKGVDLVKDLISSPAVDYSGTGHGSVVVEVKSGETSTDIAGTLLDAGVVKSAEAFIDAATANPDSTSIQDGFYLLKKQMSGASALKLLLDPDSRVSKPLTIPEGMTAKEILELIADNTDFSQSEVQKAFDDTSALGLPSYANGEAEGYLFPATYEITPNMAAADLLATMVETFKERADELDLEGKADDLGISPHDAVIVASLVQGEASRTEDMPKVASVAYNRLDTADMPLEFDSTNKYAVESLGVDAPDGNTLVIDSPYNSYEHVGLPPTPIDSPGEDALAAALDPANTDYLYFVTVNLRTGETKFAETLAEHERFVAELDEYCTTSDAC